MAKRQLILSILVMLIVTASAHANTVEYVSLQVTSNPSPDWEGGLDYSYEHRVNRSGWIQGYRLPFITAEDHEVTIMGHLTDFLDRVQIVHGSSVVRTIKKEDLIWVGHTDEYGGKGKIVFKVKHSDLPGIGENFKIRIRFAIETAGYDLLHCKVVRRGTINRVDWTTDNDAELPELEALSSGTYEDMTRDHVYSLKFTCMKCADSIQVSDGITTKLLGQTVTHKSVSGGTLNRKITTTFRMTNLVAGGNVRRQVKLADSGIGNIEGGWGDYVYARLRPSLPGRTAAEPNRTTLERVRFTTGNSNSGNTNSGSSGVSGNTGQGTIVGCRASTPAPTIPPVIEGPIVNSCVGQPAGNRASVNFEFGDVESACGSAAYQIEIQRVDANCAPVNWTGPSSGFTNFGRCWIADQNGSFHSEVLDRGTTYRWRTRANSSSSYAGAGPWSAFQTFTTGSAPTTPIFTGQPVEGSQVHMGNVVSTGLSIAWGSTQCGGESFRIRVFENNQQVATLEGVGNTANVPIRRDRAYRVELVVTTIWGISPVGSLRFSTTQ